MKLKDIKNVLSSINTCPSKWELDTIVWHDRTSNPETLIRFLNHIECLDSLVDKNPSQVQELEYLTELLDDIDQKECEALFDRTDSESREAFIEDLARTSAIEILTSGKLNFELMNTACKLSPNDFILCAKRTQDLINSIQGLVIKGETLSKDIAGA